MINYDETSVLVSGIYSTYNDTQSLADKMNFNVAVSVATYTDGMDEEIDPDIGELKIYS